MIDLYRVRRMIECQAIIEALPRHPGIGRMRSAVTRALKAREQGDWLTVGTANLAFHAGIIELTDSPPPPATL